MRTTAERARIWRARQRFGSESARAFFADVKSNITPARKPLCMRIGRLLSAKQDTRRRMIGE
jgi:hypothetical protein